MSLPTLPPLSTLLTLPRSHAPTLLPLLTLLTLTACSVPRPLRGGRASTSGPLCQSLVQSDNPSLPSRQDQQTLRLRAYTLPTGTRLAQTALAQVPLAPPAGDFANQKSKFKNQKSSDPLAFSPQPSAFLLSAPMPVLEREEIRASTELGAAQKDTARDVAVKLSSLNGIVWVGVALFVFGLASLVWPPLKAIIGSVTTSAAVTLGGIALMVLPTLIVGNELLILGGVALTVGAWFLAHRHGHLRGQLSLVAPPRSEATPVAPERNRGTKSGPVSGSSSSSSS